MEKAIITFFSALGSLALAIYELTGAASDLRKAVQSRRLDSAKKEQLPS